MKAIVHILQITEVVDEFFQNFLRVGCLTSKKLSGLDYRSNPGIFLTEFLPLQDKHNCKIFVGSSASKNVGGLCECF